MIQKTLIDKILNPILRVFPKNSNKKRINIAMACVVLFYLQIFLQESFIVKYDYRYTFCIGGLLLLVFLFSLVETSIKKINFNRLVIYPWIGVGILMTLSAVYNSSPEYLPLGICFLIITPVSYVMLNSADYDNVFYVLNKATIISFVIYILGSLILFPQFIVNYPGLFNNANGAGFYLLTVFAVLLIEIIYNTSNIVNQVVRIVLIGICGTYIFYTNSRTSYIAVLGIIIAIIVLELFTKVEKIKLKKMLIKLIGIAAVVVTILAVNAVPLIYSAYEKTDISNKLELEREDEYLIILEEEYSEANKNGNAINGNETFGIFKENIVREGQNINEISAGRVTIWREYAGEINILGNPFEKEISELTREDGSAYASHNIWLELAYRGGIVAGVLFMYINIVIGIKSAKHSIAKKRPIYSKEPIVIAICFGIVGMLSNIMDMFSWTISFLYFISLFPFFKVTEK